MAQVQSGGERQHGDTADLKYLTLKDCAWAAYAQQARTGTLRVSKSLNEAEGIFYETDESETETLDSEDTQDTLAYSDMDDMDASSAAGM